MKKFLVSFLLIIACVVTAVCFAGCNNGSGIGDGEKNGESNSELDLTFGEKYGKDDYCYVFNEDGTGKEYYYHKYEDEYGSEAPVSSYTVSFLWEIQSDNCIHLIFDSVTYNSDHTASKNVKSVNSHPFAFSKDLLSYTYVSGGQYTTSTNVSYFIRQGSRLDVSN